MHQEFYLCNDLGTGKVLRFFCGQAIYFALILKKFPHLCTRLHCKGRIGKNDAIHPNGEQKAIPVPPNPGGKIWNGRGLAAGWVAKIT
jgi:hypothetical protein